MPSPSERSALIRHPVSSRGRRAILTGAGSGLGRALALHLAAAGWRVAVSDRDLAGAEATLAQLQAAGGEGFAAVLDVTREADFAALAARLSADWGGVDLLVNNAGVASAGTVLEAPLAQWHWIVDINLLGCVRGVQAFVPLMPTGQGAHVVNIASFAGIANPPAMASYNATKAAVIALSETLRFELAPQGIGVSVACPSFFKTRLMETSRASAAAVADTPVTDSTAPQMGRIVTRLMERASVSAEDVARDIVTAVEQGHFLVISHADARRRYHLKRLAPELYFRLARKATAAFLQRR